MYMISHTGRPPLAGEFTSELPQSHAITDERPPSRLYAAAQPSSSNMAESYDMVYPREPSVPRPLTITMQ